jgi:hypothetical protein
MNVELHIERLVLDGVRLDRAGERVFRAAFQAELTRLIAEGGVSGALSATTPRVIAPAVSLAAESGPMQWGEALARSVYGGLGAGQSR